MVFIYRGNNREAKMDSEQILIKERRTVEALKKDLMGPSGKLGTICKYLGSQIYHQGNGLDGVFLDDPYDTPNDFSYNNEDVLKDLQEFDENGNVYEIGWIFSGLSSGMHLEIKYIDNEKKLTATHKGHIVYTEISGELESYAPSNDWEGMVEKLYKVAKDKKKKKLIVDKAERKELIIKKQKNFLQKMIDKWGM